jgi:hypothetical protein
MFMINRDKAKKFRPTHLIGLFFLTIFLMASALPPWCQAPDPAFEASGLIVSVDTDAQQFDLTTETGVITIRTTESTVYSGGNLAGFQELMPQKRVKVTGNTAKGFYWAAEVYVEPVTAVLGTLDISQIPNVSDPTELEVVALERDGSITHAPIAEDNTFRMEVAIAQDVYLDLQIARQESREVIGAIVFALNAAGDSTASFPVTDKHNVSLVVDLGLISPLTLSTAEIRQGLVSEAAFMFFTPAINPLSKIDTDADGRKDYWDDDDDSNMVPDAKDDKDIFLDADNDNIPDLVDEDDDNDAILDHYDSDDNQNQVVDKDERDMDHDGVGDEVDIDLDNDGLRNDADKDDDNDGISDVYELDTDKDKIPDDSDPDIDNDGKRNQVDDDDDADGILDEQDSDACFTQCEKWENGEITADDCKPCACNRPASKLSGRIQKIFMDEHSLMIEGIKIFADANTIYIGGPAEFANLSEGLFVEVKGGPLLSGTFIAYQFNANKSSSVLPFSFIGVVQATNPESQQFSLRNLASAMADIPVSVDGATQFKNGLSRFADMSSGQIVTVTGEIRDDHRYTAKSITLQTDLPDSGREWVGQGHLSEVNHNGSFVVLSYMDGNGSGQTKKIWLSSASNFEGSSGLNELAVNQQVQVNSVLLIDPLKGAELNRQEIGRMIRRLDVPLNFSLQGKIRALDQTEKSFQLETHGVSGLITTTANTQYFDIPGGFAGLSLGQTVQVTGIKEQNGDLRATVIELPIY